MMIYSTSNRDDHNQSRSSLELNERQVLPRLFEYVIMMIILMIWK